LLVVAKVGLGILLALAPFMISMYFFDATRSLFEGWLRQLLSFAIIPVLLFSLLGLLLGVVQEFAGPVVNAAQESQPLPSVAQVAPYLVVVVTAVLLTTQVVSWSSGIAGALALSVSPAAIAKTIVQTVQSAARAASHRSQAPERKGPVGVGVQAISQTARTAAAFTGGAFRHAAGLRPARQQDPSWRPRAPTPPRGANAPSASSSPGAPSSGEGSRASSGASGASAGASGAASDSRSGPSAPSAAAPPRSKIPPVDAAGGKKG